MRTDGRTGIVAFRNFANAPKISVSTPHSVLKHVVAMVTIVLQTVRHGNWQIPLSLDSAIGAAPIT
jgi:hypothetical protein